jgi:hypothetical protein
MTSGLEQPDHRLGERVLIAVADGANRRLDAGLRQALGVRDRDILHAAVAMVNEIVVDRTAVMQRLLERRGRSRSRRCEKIEYAGLDRAFLAHRRLRRWGALWNQWLDAKVYPKPPETASEKMPISTIISVCYPLWTGTS